MKLRNVTNKWDNMTENAFDHLDVMPGDDAKAVYDDMYKYAVELEAEVKRQRGQLEMYRDEIRALNRANARKALRIQAVNLFRKVFP